MSKLEQSAIYVCIATRQIGIEFSTNEYGPGPKVFAKSEDFPDTAISWKDPKFCLWLENKDNPKHLIVYPPSASKVIFDEEKNLLLVEMVKMHYPTAQDYDEYAARCGCKTSDEAVQLYGDLHWCIDAIEVLVRGTEVKAFLDFTAPYCWAEV